MSLLRYTLWPADFSLLSSLKLNQMNKKNISAMALESRFSAADVPVTVTCSSYQHAEDCMIAPFLQRACNRQPSDSPWNQKLAEGRFFFLAQRAREILLS